MGLVCIPAWSQPFRPGHYFTREGEKVTGLLRFNLGGDPDNILTRKNESGPCSITFKESKDGDKIELTAADICCFVIGRDTFAVSTLADDFAQVQEVGKIKLFLYYTYKYRPNPNGLSTKLVEEKWAVEKEGTFETLSRKTFKKFMPAYLADYPELAEKVRNKVIGFEYENTRQIIARYNEYFRTGNK